VVNRRASIDFGECSQRLAMTLFIQGEIPLNRFLNDPTSRALEPLRKAVELASELVWNVRSYDPLTHVNHSESD
jgi:hypothetical protein